MHLKLTRREFTGGTGNSFWGVSSFVSLLFIFWFLYYIFLLYASMPSQVKSSQYYVMLCCVVSFSSSSFVVLCCFVLSWEKSQALVYVYIHTYIHIYKQTCLFDVYGFVSGIFWMFCAMYLKGPGVGWNGFASIRIKWNGMKLCRRYLIRCIGSALFLFFIFWYMSLRRLRCRPQAFIWVGLVGCNMQVDFLWCASRE